MTLRHLTTAALLAIAGAAPLAAQGSPSTAPAVPRAGGDVDAAINRVARTYRNVKSARATFEQTITNPLTGTTTVQAGELFQQGKRWSARFTKPQGDRYVLNGRTFWIYTPSSAPKQAVRLTLDPDAVASFDVVQQFANEPRKRFTVTAAGPAIVGGRPAQAVQLVPKERGRLSKAVIWVDDRDGAVRQFELTEASGLVRRVQLSNLRFNVPVAASEFAFTPPAGVRVIDQESFTGR